MSWNVEAVNRSSNCNPGSQTDEKLSRLTASATTAFLLHPEPLIEVSLAEAGSRLFRLARFEAGWLRTGSSGSGDMIHKVSIPLLDVTVVDGSTFAALIDHAVAISRTGTSLGRCARVARLDENPRPQKLRTDMRATRLHDAGRNGSFAIHPSEAKVDSSNSSRR
jgi:hypothetical protein